MIAIGGEHEHCTVRTSYGTYLRNVLGERKFELIPEFVHDEMIDHATGMRGPSALLAHASGFCDNIPDVTINVEEIIATENSAFGIWNWDGEPVNPMGFSESGSAVFPTRVMSFFRLQEGMLVEYEAFVDAGQVRKQITS